MILLSLQVSALLIDIHKGPALDAFSPLIVCNLDVFENLSFLLFRAVEVLKLFLEPLIRHLGLLNRKFTGFDLGPINFSKEWMLFYFVRALFACSKTLTRVPVEQMDDQVLGFD